MATYIEYELDDGNTILVESAEQEGRVVPAGLGESLVVKTADRKFKDALAAIKPTAIALSDLLHDLGPDAYEVKFGVKVVGQSGNIAVGTLGGELNYEVTLKWGVPQTKQ